MEEYLPWSKKFSLSLSKEKGKIQMKKNKTNQPTYAVAFHRKVDMAAKIKMACKFLEIIFLLELPGRILA